jgi:hypothetical protein
MINEFNESLVSHLESNEASLRMELSKKSIRPIEQQLKLLLDLRQKYSDEELIHKLKSL